MLVGMVMYISVFKAEVGSKLRPRSSFQVSQISKTHLMFTSLNKEKRKGKTMLFSNDINLNIFNLKFQSGGKFLHFTNFRKNKSLYLIWNVEISNKNFQWGNFSWNHSLTVEYHTERRNSRSHISLGAIRLLLICIIARVNEYLGRNLAISGTTLHLQVRILIFAVREWLHHDRGRWNLRHFLVYFLAPERTATERFQAKKLRGW